MKTTITTKLALASAALATLISTGCWTPPTQMPPQTAVEGPLGSWVVTQTDTGTAIVEAKQPGMAMQRTDTEARVMLVDRSYRLLTLLYTDGHTQTFKVALPDTLQRVLRGDSVVFRASSGPPVSQKTS